MQSEEAISMIEDAAIKKPWTERLVPLPPQKYTDNIAKYLARGGILDLDADIDRFSHNDRIRFYAFCMVVDQISKEGILGDFAELGVHRGHSARFLASIARRLGRKTFLLDTFEGFHKGDLGENERALAGAFANTTLDAVRRLVGEEETLYIKGRFPETAGQFPDDVSFALAHIDCDLGEPMMAGLQYFYPRMTPGGFIIMHDYNSLYWDGAEKAIDDFFADKPESVIPLPDMCGSVVVRKFK
ncbi:TylF/MycF/NovP-related O-methyltransferase [Paraburkholderia tropica]|uniref:TylF/MycF/NovP-related O-methyltransferase n=1 Tax=Paraburkholderia tropica TaxID=92647 RepID=UPI00160C7CCD|nr:TylF/MycF/NovP-related O-methyltransferase [Paraburkholderia tropica]